jgi:hypothetical protein
MTRPARRRRGRSGLLLGLLAVLVLLWVGYWYAAHSIADAAIDRVTTAEIGGHVVDCGGRSLGGFPLRLDLRCVRATYAEPNRQLTAAIDGVSTTAPLYWPGYVEATIDGPLVVNAPALDLAVTSSWQQATGNAMAGLSGLKSIAATFLKPRVENSSGQPGWPIAAASADTATVTVEPGSAGSYTLFASANGLVLARKDGSRLPVIDGEARFSALDVGGALGMDPMQTILDWLRTGGTLEIERLKLTAAGNTTDVSGHLTISDTGVLTGNLDVRFTNLAALPDLAEAISPGSRDQAAQAAGVLAAFTIPVETEYGPARQTTLVIKDGLVAVGIIPVGQIPPIRF